jgi:DNA-binding MarR family transcriptional regulator
MKTAARPAARQRAAPTTAVANAADLPTATALKLWVVLARAFWAEFAILEALHHKGPLLLGDVQKKVLVSSGGITFLIDRLATRGLVERQACASDRRARYAALTRRGSKLMGEIFPAHAAAIREAMAGLGRVEQRQLAEMLKTLGREAMRVAAETPGCKMARAEEEETKRKSRL